MNEHKQEHALTREAILDTLGRSDALLKKYGVRRIGLFGSYALGTQTAGSDVDFLVEFSEPTYDNFIGLTDALERLLNRKVDILTPDGLDTIRVPEVADSIRKALAYG